jgi:hypothetical protein
VLHYHACFSMRGTYDLNKWRLSVSVLKAPTNQVNRVNQSNQSHHQVYQTHQVNQTNQTNQSKPSDDKESLSLLNNLLHGNTVNNYVQIPNLPHFVIIS